LPGQARWNHLHTNTGSNICIKTHTKESPEYITQFKPRSTPKGLVITTMVMTW
jgi:hypothetical protein